MLIAVDFALPVTQSQCLVHLFPCDNKPLAHSTPNVEWLLTCGHITFDALTVFLIANLTLHVELCVVELATEHFEFCVIFFKPDVIDPVDSTNVHPLFGLQVNNGTLNIWAEHAGGSLLAIVVKQVQTA